VAGRISALSTERGGEDERGNRPSSPSDSLLEAQTVTTLTIVPTRSIATEDSPRAPLLARLVERIIRLPWQGQTSLDGVLARAIDEAFESLAREART
jgi:hypothetical protein